MSNLINPIVCSIFTIGSKDGQHVTWVGIVCGIAWLISRFLQDKESWRELKGTGMRLSSYIREKRISSVSPKPSIPETNQSHFQTAITSSFPNSLTKTSMKHYFIVTNGNRRGPYVLSQIQSMWNSGAITADALYWTEGLPENRPILDLLAPSDSQSSETAISRGSVPSSPASVSSQPEELVPEAEFEIVSPAQSQISSADEVPTAKTSYMDVPWTRRGGVLNVFSGIGVLFWLLGGSLLSFIVLLFPSIMALTGDVYTTKLGPDGTLKNWTWNYKIAPIVLCVLMLAGTIFRICTKTP